LEVLGDSGYGAGATRAALRAAGHTQTIKPIPLQSAVPGGFSVHDFRLDRQAGSLRCPAGQIAPITSSGRVSFARWCRGCPLRRRCTTAKGGRTIHLHRHEDELRAARRQTMTRTFQQRYRRWRPMVERSIAWLVADGCRRVPYRDPAQRPVVVAAGRRGQPATAAGAWPCPPRRRLGAGLTALSAPMHRLDRPLTTIVQGAGRPSLPSHTNLPL
jgi:Transposase DDE domain